MAAFDAEAHAAGNLPYPARLRANGRHLHLDLSSKQFEAELRRRYGRSHPDLVFRAESTFERARLDRHRHAHLPRVIPRQGSPPKHARMIDKLIDPSCLVRQDE